MTRDLSPRPDCPIGDACGYAVCTTCGWGELNGMRDVCAAAEEEQFDREVMMAVEGALFDENSTGGESDGAEAAG